MTAWAANAIEHSLDAPHGLSASGEPDQSPDPWWDPWWDPWPDDPLDVELAPWRVPELPDGRVPVAPPAPEPLLPAGCRMLPEPSPDERLDEAFEQLDRAAVLESQAFARTAAALDAVQFRARQVDRSRGDHVTSDFLDLHVAGSLTVQQTTVDGLLQQARHLVRNLPGTWQALDDGWLRVHQARVIVDLTDGMTAEQCAVIEARVLPRAAGRSRASLRRQVRRLLVSLRDQAQAEKQRRRAVADRGVHASQLEDGMAAVTATMPAHAQVLFLTALRQLAERCRTPGDTRTVQQRMSDVLAGLPAAVLRMLAGDHGGVVQNAAARELSADGLRVTGPIAPIQALLLVPLDTALHGSHCPADLIGYGPVSADYARQLLAGAQIRTGTVDTGTGRLTAISALPTDLRPGTTAPTCRSAHTEPGDGLPDTEPGWLWLGRLRERLAAEFGQANPAHSSDRPGSGSPSAPKGGDSPAPRPPTGPPTPPPNEPQYRPSVALTRLLRWRDRHCIGPGCSVPATQCDLEHRAAWPLGPTGPDNLAPVSRHCHRAKQAGWRYVRGPDGGTTWYPPRSGRSYLVPPEAPPDDG